MRFGVKGGDWLVNWKSLIGSVFCCTLLVLFLVSSGHPEMYQWVDEKGTVHFTDDLTKIPEKQRPDAQTRQTPKPLPSPGMKPDPTIPTLLKSSDQQAFQVDLIRVHELWMAEVTLEERVKKRLIVDTGSTFTLISRQTANDLGIIIDEDTPVIPGTTVSGTILTPLVTLKSVRVGEAYAENVEAIVHNLPSRQDGLLGNSFLNKFKVLLDSANERMTLLSLEGEPSPDRPGGYGREYWTGQFRFYHRNLADLKRLQGSPGSQWRGAERRQIDSAIRYFENQLSDLERKASLAGVPRSWRD